MVTVHFANRTARKEFESAWIRRTGGAPIDDIVDGVSYAGANAERAIDIANEVPGVVIVEAS
jgi:hypothetical protein